MLLHFLQQYLWNETTWEKWSLVPPSVLLYPSSSLPISTLPDLTTCSPRHQETIRHSAATSHSLLWTSHLLSPLYFPLSVSRSVTCLLALSPPCPLPSLCTVWGMVYEHMRFGVSPRKLNKDKDIWRNICRLCHIDSWLTHILISATMMVFFCQMLSCCFPCSTCFIHSSLW